VIDATVADARQSGLVVRLHLSGGNRADVQMNPEVSTALLGALSAAVANVRRHAAVDAFDLMVGATASELVVAVVDEGRGFDLNQVSGDRLGLRTSVSERLAAVGGRATIWSTIGRGTTVTMRVPLIESAPAIITEAAER
jgi:signal transduction histidine kinase